MEKTNNKKRVLPWILLAASVVLGAVSLLVLPETVVTQLSAGGSGVTTMPKFIAVLIPLALGVGGALASILSKEEGKGTQKTVIISVVGVAVFIIMLIVNCL